MNSESVPKLSMEELLRKNAPPPTPQPQPQITQMISDEQWKQLLYALYEISDRTELLTSTLHTKSLPSASQMTELIQQMKLLNESLKKPEPIPPVGKRKEKRFSLPAFHLSLPEWPTVFLLVMTLAVAILLLLWFKSGGDWSSFSLLKP